MEHSLSHAKDCMIWENLKPSSITNCFPRARFPPNSTVDNEECMADMNKEWAKILKYVHMDNISFQDFVEVDSELVTSGITEESVNFQSEAESSDDSEDEEVEIVQPKNSEMNTACAVLERIFCPLVQQLKGNFPVFYGVRLLLIDFTIS
ncbi:hypothetical protein J437_LFUL018908 [Ladona fulva]|uniref:Uncharacterized protein n=1 Tax=Ladona fulva TaxID=123851 RepID=A0A8K0PAW0_LADFU|nr:hypothetical protein J437_LFUL018908 [Ladona fulva]